MSIFECQGGGWAGPHSGMFRQRYLGDEGRTVTMGLQATGRHAAEREDAGERCGAGEGAAERREGARRARHARRPGPQRRRQGPRLNPQQQLASWEPLLAAVKPFIPVACAPTGASMLAWCHANACCFCSYWRFHARIVPCQCLLLVPLNGDIFERVPALSSECFNRRFLRRGQWWWRS